MINKPEPHDPAANPPIVSESIAAMLAARRKRHGGWTAISVAAFLTVLEDTGNVAQAAAYAGKSPAAAYHMRNHPDGEPFAAAWDAIMSTRHEMLTDIAVRRCTEGFNRAKRWRGEIVGHDLEFSDPLLMFMIRQTDPLRRRVDTSLERPVPNEREPEFRRRVGPVRARVYDRANEAAALWSDARDETPFSDAYVAPSDEPAFDDASLVDPDFLDRMTSQPRIDMAANDDGGDEPTIPTATGTVPTDRFEAAAAVVHHPAPAIAASRTKGLFPGEPYDPDPGEVANATLEEFTTWFFAEMDRIEVKPPRSLSTKAREAWLCRAATRFHILDLAFRTDEAARDVEKRRSREIVRAGS